MTSASTPLRDPMQGRAMWRLRNFCLTVTCLRHKSQNPSRLGSAPSPRTGRRAGQLRFQEALFTLHSFPQSAAEAITSG